MEVHWARGETHIAQVSKMAIPETCAMWAPPWAHWQSGPGPVQEGPHSMSGGISSEGELWTQTASGRSAVPL